MPSRFHVCFVCNELPPAPAGGIGPCVLTTARHLARLGHDVTIVGLYERNFGWDYAGIRVLPLLRGPRPTSLLRRGLDIANNRLRLRKAIGGLHQKHHIDLVEWPDFEGLFWQPLDGIADVVRNHGPVMSHRLHNLVKRQPHIEWFEKRTLRRIENWIGVSEWFMNEWLRITKARPTHRTVLYNPVDCELFRPPECLPTDNLILYTGSLIERKGVFALARAARDFLARLPNARLLFVGRDITGLARSRIQREAGEGVVERVLFSDPLPQPQLAELLRQSTVFAMPSLLESFGNVWAEAMASGVPVLGSRRTCGPEIVPHNVAGFLVEPTNSAEVSDRIVELMSDRDLRARFGAEGRRIARQRFATDVIIPATVAFYQECVS